MAPMRLYVEVLPEDQPILQRWARVDPRAVRDEAAHLLRPKSAGAGRRKRRAQAAYGARELERWPTIERRGASTRGRQITRGRPKILRSPGRQRGKRAVPITSSAPL